MRNVGLKHAEVGLTETHYLYDKTIEKSENAGNLNQSYRLEIIAINEGQLSSLIQKRALKR